VTTRIGTNGIDVACHDCGRRLLPSGREGHEWYMTHDDVWDQSGMAPLGGCLCAGCLQVRLGRPLTGDDLSAELPINAPSVLDSDPLYALKVAAEIARFRRAPRRPA
jgi:hypothetical protein